MAGKKITIDVELRTKINKAKEIFDKIDAGKGFSGESGSAAKSKVLGNWGAIQGLLKEASLTEDQFKNLESAVKTMYNVLNTYASKIEGLSEEAQKLQEKINKNTKNRDTKTDKLETQKEKTSNKKIELINAIQDKKIHLINEKGNLQGGGALKVDTIISKLSEGQKLGYKDQEGNLQTITNDSMIGQLVNEYRNEAKKTATLSSQVQKANEKIDELIKQLKEQINADKQSGGPGAELTQKTIESQNEVSKGFNNIRKNINNEKHTSRENAAIADVDVKNIEKQSSALGQAFKQFTLYNLALKATKKALREAVQTIKELDKELTEQAMVTGLTRKETYALIDTYQDLALATGATTKEIASVATEYIKQGKSIQEATVLTEAAVSAAKVARVSVGDSVNYLTTALNGFQLAAEDAMLVSDKFAAVAAASATDYDELAIALSKVASQANLAGMSIDYTTALLTKGLETTREAPETMGTALKTIIARMRELGDYGETLEGDTDINNVEKQLAYVDIALRDTNGELRSTEEVLDELGKKWDTLNKNQQAAVAKALAGTRQQSRLIAMMSDYERVTELQQISQRSAGATAAQAGVYLEGMEASLNKITVAWEKIVTSLTNSDTIIGIIGTIGNMLDAVGDFMSTSTGQVAVLGTILTIITQGLSAKMQEVLYSKEEQRLERKKLKLQLELAKQEIKNRKARVGKLADEKRITAEKKLQTAVSREGITEAERQAAITQYNLEIAQIDAEQEIELYNIKQDELKILYQEQQLGLSRSQTAWNIASATTMTAGMFGGLVEKSGVLMTTLSVISGILQVIPTFIQLATSRQKKQNAELLKGAVLSEASGLAKFWPWGVIAAAALLAIVGIGVAISQSAGQTSKAADEVNELSNEIYKLNEKANAINQITDSYDALDKKIIQTKKDQEEMNSLLDQAADKLSDDEKKDYSSLGTAKQKREYLNQIEAQARAAAKQKRQEQIDLFKDNPELLNENTANSTIKQAQSAIYANATFAIQESIDQLKEENKTFNDEWAMAVEELVSTMVDEASLKDALAIAESQTKQKELLNAIKDLKIETEEGVSKTAEVITSDDYGIADKARAFKQLADELGRTSNEYKMLEAAYQDYAIWADMNEDLLKFISNMGWSNEQINQMGEGWKKLQKAGIKISEEIYKNMLTGDGGILATLQQTGGDVASTIDGVFGTYLSQIKGDAEEYAEAYNAIVNIFAETMSIGMSNMGQNLEKLGNSVNSVYEKASGWWGMSESDKMSFLQDNADLFEGESGSRLLAAFESGNYRAIEQALKENKGYQDKLTNQLKQINNELAVEEARIGEDRNEAYIKYLKEWKAKIQDPVEMFRADLQVLIDQEQKQLDIYKDYLNKQQEELEDSLEKRKEAYESYFDAINEQKDDADYEEERSRLVTNISKLATSTDAASQKQMADLESQLMELEKERQQTLRERAQDALLEGLDKNVEDINSKFDELLNNEGLLLKAMNQDLKTNPHILSDILHSAIADGQMTALSAEQYIQDLVSAFASTGVDTSGIQEAMTAIQNNATFNLSNGQTVNLDSDAAAELWLAIQSILIKKGYGN